jgi:dipeptidase E
MKLLLTSAGIKNAAINDAMVDLLGKPVAECDALCIFTASYGHAPRGIHGAYRFITGQATTPMVELGWKSLGILELTALPTLDRELWLPVVQASDALLVNGGDAIYLAHHMRESGLAELLPSLSPVWVSLSAGSMVMTPRIGEDFKVWEPPGGGDRALGIVDFSIFPHVDHPDLPENTMAAAEQWRPGWATPPTRSTTTPRSGSSTARSTSSQQATGGSSPRSVLRAARTPPPAGRPRRAPIHA